jgi:hypothetical protein
MIARSARRGVAAKMAIASILLSFACGSGRGPEEPPRTAIPVQPTLEPCSGTAAYEARAAPSGRLPTLPAPVANEHPIKIGNAYTVWGASYYLRSRVHHREVENSDHRDPRQVTIEITGYITKTNLPDAPPCAVHRTGSADADGCTAPVPAFWIGDRKDAPEGHSIKVVGWASNYAHIYDAIVAYDRSGDDTVCADALWAVTLPHPLPSVGAKVTVKGYYGAKFTKSGVERDRYMGILDSADIHYLEPAPELATLPGVKRPNRPINRTARGRTQPDCYQPQR